MELNSILQAVSNYGFPIVCVFVLFIYVNKLDERHQAETKALSDALNNNTLALTKLASKLGVLNVDELE